MGRGIGGRLTQIAGPHSGAVSQLVTGLEFTSDAQSILGGAGSWNSTILSVLVRWVPLTRPANNTLSIAMVGDFAANFNLITYANTGFTYAPETAFNGAYASAPGAGIGNGCDVTQAGRLGIMRTDVVRLVSGTAIQHWRDGRQVGRQGTSAATTLGSTNALAINRRVSSATLGYGNFALVEIRATTAALTDAQIAQWSASPVGTSSPAGGETNVLVASDFNGSTIPPRVGGGTYTAAGSPVLKRYRRAPAGLGSIECMGDSITLGRASGPVDGNGWRREVLQLLNGSRHATMSGQFTPATTNLTPDFSTNHTGVSGMGLGATPAAGTTRLSTVATDRDLSIGPAGITILSFGRNDIFRRCRAAELNQTPAAAVSAMQTDWTNEIAGLRVTRTGPIVVTTTLRCATSATEANERTAIDLWNAALPGYVSAWNSTYGNVFLCDYTTAATPNQAAADSAAVLYDGTHPTAATYTVMAGVIAGVLGGL
jgi:lysophospholipase L1-like esterase